MDIEDIKAPNERQTRTGHENSIKRKIDLQSIPKAEREDLQNESNLPGSNTMVFTKSVGKFEIKIYLSGKLIYLM